MSTEQCDLLREISSNLPYHLLITLKCTFCVIGAIGISFQWKRQGVRFLVHDNTKVVFKLCYALNLFIAISYAWAYIFELIRLRFDCVLINFRTVLLSRGMGLSAVISAHYLVLLISVERLYSSLFPARFEKHSNKRLALVLSVTVILTSWYYVMSHLSNDFTLFGTHLIAVSEERIPANQIKFDETVFTGVISTAFSIFMFSSDIYLNFIRKNRAANPSLSISYQRSENRRILLIMLPIEIMQALLGFATTSALMLQAKFIDISNPMQRLLYQEFFTFPVCLPLILAIIIEFRVARRVLPSVTTSENTVEHFDILRRAWQQ